MWLTVNFIDLTNLFLFAKKQLKIYNKIQITRYTTDCKH